jgi:hypothetical protein
MWGGNYRKGTLVKNISSLGIVKHTSGLLS